MDSLDSMFKHTWRSPVRMAADNQTFLARLSSIQLAPAATEAVVAAAAAAGFPLHLPGSGSRPATPPVATAHPSVALLSNGSVETQQIQQRQQQQPAAQTAQMAMLQLLLSDPLSMPAWQQQHGMNPAMLLQQQQQQVALQQQQQQAANLVAASIPMPAAATDCIEEAAAERSAADHNRGSSSQPAAGRAMLEGEPSHVVGKEGDAPGLQHVAVATVPHLALNSCLHLQVVVALPAAAAQ